MISKFVKFVYLTVLLVAVAVAVFLKWIFVDLWRSSGNTDTSI
jgi:hypothetical protein